MKITVKRAYDDSAEADGFRVLIDRLWPRGVSKERARIDLWAKDIAPSAALRSWFHEDTETRYGEFCKRYKKELAAGTAVAELKQSLRGKTAVTFVTAVKDITHSHVPVLLDFMR